MPGTVPAPYLQQLSYPNNLGGRTTIPIVLRANGDSEKTDHFQISPCPSVTRADVPIRIYMAFYFFTGEGFHSDIEANEA